MTCHTIEDGICRGRTPVEVMAAVAANASRYGWTDYTVSFVKDAPHNWRALWCGSLTDGRRRAWHSHDTYRTRRAARTAWDLALVVEALS